MGWRDVSLGSDLGWALVQGDCGTEAVSWCISSGAVRLTCLSFGETHFDGFVEELSSGSLHDTIKLSSYPLSSLNFHQ